LFEVTGDDLPERHKSGADLQADDFELAGDGRGGVRRRRWDRSRMRR
jgi:hypothetical protein